MSRLRDEGVLFKDQGWIIKGIPGYEDMFDTVYHKCKWKWNFLLQYKPISTWEMKTMQTCMHCGADIPDSIMGLWKLKNFDLLEEPQYQEELSPFYSSNYLYLVPGGFFYMGSGTPIGQPGQIWEYKP
ncbi:hypothetical protein LCGC14_0209520 [marine sediment metagenome]|uniref:Uncharacterized protein n=1 Tax=marine sediment metagenome TaxID=412755 RepID=A0A0F9X125_9ZZZZ